MVIVNKECLCKRLLCQVGKSLLVFSFLSLVLLPQQVRAHSQSGKVIGTVLAQSRAVIDRAPLTNRENGLVLTTASNSASGLNLPAVPRAHIAMIRYKICFSS